MMHKHKCANASCGVVWEHSTFDAAKTHNCPVCGLFTADIYAGPDEATPAEAIAQMKAARQGRKTRFPAPEARS